VNTAKISLGFHSNHDIKELVEFADYANRLGFHRIWMDDPPDSTNPLSVTQQIRKQLGGKIRVGLGALSTAKWINYEPKRLLGQIERDTELAIAPGDVKELTDSFKRGIIITHMKKLLLAAKALGLTTFLAAQGPSLLRYAKRVDGAMVNFINPDPVRWALSQTGKINVKCLGPSLVYKNRFTQQEYRKLIAGANVVRKGAGIAVRKLFPALTDYYLLADLEQASTIVDSLSESGVQEIILSYPQTMSKKLITAASTLLG
jgi:hypothetical protein